MLPVSTTKDTASDIFKRYKMDDLQRMRVLRRHYYGSRFSSLVDDLPLLDPLHSYDHPYYTSSLGLWNPVLRRHYRSGNYPISGRKGLPDIPSRSVYNRRLADMFAEQREASRKADALLLTDYLNNRAILPPSVIAPEDELELLALEEAVTTATNITGTATNTNTENDANDDDVTEVDENDDDTTSKRAVISERDAHKERMKILNQIRNYRRRYGPSRIVTRSMNRYLYDL